MPRRPATDARADRATRRAHVRGDVAATRKGGGVGTVEFFRLRPPTCSIGRLGRRSPTRRTEKGFIRPTEPQEWVACEITPKGWSPLDENGPPDGDGLHRSDDGLPKSRIRGGVVDVTRHRFDVALSFPGEYRSYVERVAAKEAWRLPALAQWPRDVLRPALHQFVPPVEQIAAVVDGLDGVGIPVRKRRLHDLECRNRSARPHPGRGGQATGARLRRASAGARRGTPGRR